MSQEKKKGIFMEEKRIYIYKKREEVGRNTKFREEISTQRLYPFGISPHWFREESRVIGFYMQAVVEVGLME